MSPMQPYRPRQIRFRGVRERRGWRLKVYSVVAGDSAFDAARFEAALRLAWDALPGPDEAAGRPGVGFVIAHQGRTGDYLVLAWWDHENELPLRVWVRRSAGEAWRPAMGGESVCVWDLEVVWAERRAWIDTMLAGRTPDREAYLARVDDGFRADAGKAESR